MKGIILAGGTGSRLGPLSKVTNKHLLGVGSFPMIFYPLCQLLENNITDICIVSGLYHLDKVVNLLGSGSKLGCSFTYKVQDGAGGIAEALNLCKNFSEKDNISVVLGDNIFGEVLNLSLNSGFDAKFFLKQVPDPERFGTAEVDHLKRLIDIEEKPKNPKSNLAVTGMYIYSKSIWDAIDSIERSARGELEISDANKVILSRGAVETEELLCWWSDAGTPESLKHANENVWTKLSKPIFDRLHNMAENI